MILFEALETMKSREIRRKCKCIITNYLQKPDGD